MLKKSHAGKAATANTSKHQMAQVNLLPFLILLIVFIQGTQNTEELYFDFTVLLSITHHTKESVFILCALIHFHAEKCFK